jgi:hypothetical protein
MRPGARARPTDGAGPAQPSLCSVSGHSAKTASEPVCPPQLSNQGSPRQGRDTVGGSSPSRRSAASCASQFSDPLAGPLCRNSSGRRSLRQKGSKPNKASSLVGAPNWPGRWNGHGSSLQLASTALRPGPFLRGCVLRLFLRCCCSCRWSTLLGHRFAACNGPSTARAPSGPASSRGDSIPWEGRVPPRPKPSGGPTLYAGVAGVSSPARRL